MRQAAGWQAQAFSGPLQHRIQRETENFENVQEFSRQIYDTKCTEVVKINPDTKFGGIFEINSDIKRVVLEIKLIPNVQEFLR